MLIIVHELAHLITAKLCKISIVDFSIGIGKPSFKLFKCKRIQFRASPWLLGGYVKFADKENPMPSGDERLGYRHFDDSNVFKRILVVLAGPLSNLILAVLLFYIASVLIGKPYIKPVIKDTGIYEKLQKGDVITQIQLPNHDKIHNIKQWSEIGNALTLKSDAKKINIKLNIKRNNETKNLTITAYKTEKKQFNIFGGYYESKYELKKVKPDTNATAVKKQGIIEGFKSSAVLTGYFTYGTFKGLYYIANGTLSTDNMAGPVKIVAMSNKALHVGIFTFFIFMGLISLSLAVFNLLPIPVLDGGHILFFGIEAVKGSPVNERIMKFSYKVGMFLLMTLFVYVVLQDILQVFFT